MTTNRGEMWVKMVFENSNFSKKISYFDKLSFKSNLENLFFISSLKNHECTAKIIFRAQFILLLDFVE